MVKYHVFLLYLDIWWSSASPSQRHFWVGHQTRTGISLLCYCHTTFWGYRRQRNSSFISNQLPQPCLVQVFFIVSSVYLYLVTCLHAVFVGSFSSVYITVMYPVFFCNFEVFFFRGQGALFECNSCFPVFRSSNPHSLGRNLCYFHTGCVLNHQSDSTLLFFTKIVGKVVFNQLSKNSLKLIFQYISLKFPNSSQYKINSD